VKQNSIKNYSRSKLQANVRLSNLELNVVCRVTMIKEIIVPINTLLYWILY